MSDNLHPQSQNMTGLLPFYMLPVVTIPPGTVIELFVIFCAPVKSVLFHDLRNVAWQKPLKTPLLGKRVNQKWVMTCICNLRMQRGCCRCTCHQLWQFLWEQWSGCASLSACPWSLSSSATWGMEIERNIMQVFKLVNWEIVYVVNLDLFSKLLFNFVQLSSIAFCLIDMSTV